MHGKTTTLNNFKEIHKQIEISATPPLFVVYYSVASLNCLLWIGATQIAILQWLYNCPSQKMHDFFGSQISDAHF